MRFLDKIISLIVASGELHIDRSDGPTSGFARKRSSVVKYW